MLKLQRSQIQKCIKNKSWQKFRISLKGLSTNMKLKKLEEYKKQHNNFCTNIRITNYINALKRAGQL